MRIAIVNDVLMAVEALRRVILSSSDHTIAWVATDGGEAVRRCAEDTPDLVLMDLIMPSLDGVAATRQIMAQSPCAIVVVTADVERNSSLVFEAMGAGALDAVNTPSLDVFGTGTDGHLLLGKIETIRRLLGLGHGRRPGGVPDFPPGPQPDGPHTLVAIGASAGGPAALARVLADLPDDFPAAVAIVQHVDAHFAAGLAEWLDQHSGIPVRLAGEGEAPQAGAALLAGRNQHLALTSHQRFTYQEETADCPYCPSVDVFFKSIERHWKHDVIGVLLTGIGRDGAEGLLALHRKGHHTIAQDKASSAVYGMPKAAVQLGAAAEVLALDRIGLRLKNLVMI